MTLRWSDISSWNGPIDLAGEKAVCVKISENDDYVNERLAEQHTEADRSGTWLFGYHFLTTRAPAAAQARHCYAALTSLGHPNMPIMIDCEKRQYGDGSWSTPGIPETVGFAAEFRKLGGTTWLGYFPRWYWEEIGSPPTGRLADLGLLLVSSNYPPGGYSDDGPGWDPYGNPELPIFGWQYTNNATVNGMAGVDRNAFKGSGSPSAAVTLAEFKAAARDGKAPSLLEYSRVTGQDAGTLLEWTVAARGRLSSGMHRYLQAGRLDKPMGFATIIRTVKP